MERSRWFPSACWFLQAVRGFGWRFHPRQTCSVGSYFYSRSIFGNRIVCILIYLGQLRWPHQTGLGNPRPSDLFTLGRHCAICFASVAQTPAATNSLLLLWSVLSWINLDRLDLILHSQTSRHLRTVPPPEDAARAWTGKSLKKQIWEVIEICSMQSFMFFSHQSPIHFMPMAHGWGTFQSIPCPVKPTQGEEAAEGTSFNLFLDLRWHSRALFQMTRSYAGDSDAASERCWMLQVERSRDRLRSW